MHLTATVNSDLFVVVMGLSSMVYVSVTVIMSSTIDAKMHQPHPSIPSYANKIAPPAKMQAASKRIITSHFTILIPATLSHHVIVGGGV